MGIYERQKQNGKHSAVQFVSQAYFNDKPMQLVENLVYKISFELIVKKSN